MRTGIPKKIEVPLKDVKRKLNALQRQVKFLEILIKKDLRK